MIDQNTENLKVRVPNIRIASYSAESGALISEQEFPNLIVNTGLDYINNRFAGAAWAGSVYNAANISKIVLGAGSTPAASTDTGLQSASSFQFAINIGTTGLIVWPVGNMQITVLLGASDGWGSTFKELGLFTSSSDLIGRGTYSLPIIKSSSSLTYEVIQWQFGIVATV